MSTTDQLAAVVNPTTTAPVAKPKTKAPIIVQQVLSDQFKKQLALAVPKHLNADRMARIAATEVRKNKALLNTEPTSFLGSVMQAAQLGLEPGSALGQAYLVPYGNQCQLIIGYKGMIDLARRSGQVLSLNAYAVREGDDFNFQLGLKPDIHHVPRLEADRIKKPITYVYAVATLKGGGYQFEVMSRAEVEAVKAKAKSKNIWTNYFEEMAKKTVIRRLFKYLPVSIEALEITNADAKREAGEKVEPDDVINIEAVSVKDFEDGEVVSTQENAHEPQS